MAAVAGGFAASSCASAFIAPSRDGDCERHAGPGDVAIRFSLGGSAASAATAGRTSRPEVSLCGQGFVGGLLWSTALAVAARSARRRGAGDGSWARGTRSRRAATTPRPVPGQKVVGIDLGTTTSVVATLELNEPRVVPNKEGERVTPSVVAFTKERELLVGTVAKRQAVMNPLNTFHSVKRFIGRTPMEVKEEVKHFPYTVVDVEDRKVELECPNLGRNLAPEEVSAHVLRKLKRDAEEYLRATVDHAVITVPAYFNDSQRHATKDAGRIAGLEVMRIANEPTMAALAYGLDQTNNSFIMVLDLGGGTFDVSLLEIGDGVVEVTATGGDTHLGGNDFDQRIVDWLAESFKEKEGIDLREDKQALQRLTEAAERAKTDLSTLAETRISVPFVAADESGPKHVEEVLTVKQFEGMCGDLLKRISTTIKQVYTDAQVRPTTLNQVVFVGGSSRIPMFQNLAREETNFKPVNNAVNPEEVVALGAAVNAAMLAGEVEDIMLLDVTPLTLGVETNGGAFMPVIERNTGIPVKQVKLFTTSEDCQDEIEVVVLQGERQFAENNKKLGSFRLSGLPPAPAGIPKIEVSFEIGVDGILTVTAKDWATRRKESIKVYNASTLEEWEVDKMLEDVEMHWASDEQKKEDVDLMYSAERLVMQSTEWLLMLGDRVPVDTQMAVQKKISELEEAIAIEENIELTSLKQLVQDTRLVLMKAGPRVWGNQLAPDGRPGPGMKRPGGGVTGSGSTSKGIDKYPDGKEPPSWVKQQGWKQKAAKADEEFDAKLQAKKAEAASKPTGPAMPA